MSRIPRERLSLEAAGILCGVEKIRSLATSPAVYSIWRKRGVPWEVTGPLVLERFTQTSDAHQQLTRSGGPEMHAVIDVQGRVFQIARQYGIESTEFRALQMLATLYAPDAFARDVALSPSHSDGASVPRNSAARSVRKLKSAARGRTR